MNHIMHIFFPALTLAPIFFYLMSLLFESNKTFKLKKVNNKKNFNNIYFKW